MISLAETKKNLNKLIGPFSVLRGKLQSDEVVRAVMSICHDTGADEDDLFRAVRYIIKTGGGYSGGTGVPSLIREALIATGIQGHRERVVSACKAPNNRCVGGLLLLTLSDLSETTILCPFCEAGRMRKKNHQWIEKQIEWGGTQKYNERQEMINEALKKLTENQQ